MILMQLRINNTDKLDLDLLERAEDFQHLIMIGTYAHFFSFFFWGGGGGGGGGGIVILGQKIIHNASLLYTAQYMFQGYSFSPTNYWPLWSGTQNG